MPAWSSPTCQDRVPARSALPPRPSRATAGGCWVFSTPAALSGRPSRAVARRRDRPPHRLGRTGPGRELALLATTEVSHRDWPPVAELLGRLQVPPFLQLYPGVKKALDAVFGRCSLSARGGGSLGRGMQAGGVWANLPAATGPIAAVPCPRLHAPSSRRDQTPICRAGARFEPGDSGRRVSRVVPIRLVATWTVAPQGPSPRPDRTCQLATACWPARHPSVSVCSRAC